MTTHKAETPKKSEHADLLKAIAKVNGHPDPEAYAKAVTDAMEGK